MSAHTKLHSKADFDKALETKGRYVLIHAYSGSVLDKAEECVMIYEQRDCVNNFETRFASKHKDNCDAYAVDVAEVCPIPWLCSLHTLTSRLGAEGDGVLRHQRHPSGAALQGRPAVEESRRKGRFWSVDKLTDSQLLRKNADILARCL